MIIGYLSGKCYSCVFTLRGSAIRIISVRRSRKNEQSIYHEKWEEKKMISAKKFDEMFDKGEDVLPFMDVKNAKVNYPIHRTNVDMPMEMLKKVDQEADKIGVPRTSLIN